MAAVAIPAASYESGADQRSPHLLRSPTQFRQIAFHTGTSAPESECGTQSGTETEFRREKLCNALDELCSVPCVLQRKYADSVEVSRNTDRSTAPRPSDGRTDILWRCWHLHLVDPTWQRNEREGFVNVGGSVCDYITCRCVVVACAANQRVDAVVSIDGVISFSPNQRIDGVAA